MVHLVLLFILSCVLGPFSSARRDLTDATLAFAANNAMRKMDGWGVVHVEQDLEETQQDTQASSSKEEKASTAPALALPLQLETNGRPLGRDRELTPKESCVYRIHSKPVPEFDWLSTLRVRHQTQVGLGNRARLRAAVQRWTEGKNLTIGFLGGSITAGQGAWDGHAFPYWTEIILKKAMGNRIQIHNGAVPGTLSSYMSACLNVHMLATVDIVILDYSLNDVENAHPVMDNPARRPFERLIRKVLGFPHRPAVIMLHAYRWLQIPPGVTSSYWPSAEKEFHEFAMFYALPELSVKAGAWDLMRRGVPGFMAERTRAQRTGAVRPKEEDDKLKGKVFYWDIIHPDGQTGHKFMGEMVSQAVLDAWDDVLAYPLTAEEQAEITSAPLPPPMLSNNWESASDKCFIGPMLLKAVMSHDGWTYKDEGKDEHRPKRGFISDTPGMVLKVLVNTTSATGDKEKPVTMEISYLRSYENMGKFAVSCVSGCSCEKSIVDGHTTERNSQLHLFEWKVTQSDQCLFSVEVLGETNSGKHKVKIAAVIISEEGGDGGLKNWAAVQMVMEGANNGTAFEIRAWGRL